MADSTEPSTIPPTPVLVTGGCGFLGAHIVQQLLDDPRPFAVAVVSRNPSAASRHHDSRASYHAADITNMPQIEALFNQIQPQVVIHTASALHTASSRELHHTNVQGTRVLLQCAAACDKTLAFVYTSSDSAVVPSQKLLVESEAQLYTETSYRNLYCKTKAIADAAVLAANSPSLRTATIRIPGLYGENDTNFIPQLVSSIRKGEYKTQIGPNNKLFEFVYVKSAANAHVLAAKSLLSTDTGGPKVDGEAFFVTDGKPQPFFDFARKAYAAAGYPVASDQVTVIPLGVMLVIASMIEWAYYIFTLGRKRSQITRDGIEHLDSGCHWSIDKARHRLGYAPVMEQDEAIEQTMKWAMANL
ncbi:putative 3beta-hydroxysteroid-4alpha-carboxylate 3-dehydrogenase [Microsporum ferrugineum]